MKKYILITGLLLFVISLNAQIGLSSTSSVGNSKWVYGGNIGMSGWFNTNNGVTIYGTPNIGYKIFENLVGGIEGNFSWNKAKNSSSTIFGVGPFIRFYLQRSFYATMNFRQYFITNKFGDFKNTYKEKALNIGAGYLQKLGSNAYFQVGASYNVLYKKDKSIFSGAFVPHVGVVFGL